jgi:hypothetical protein
MAMTAIATNDWQELADEPEVRIDGRVDPALEDAYWQSVYWGEPYHRDDLAYEDYAPAYCVGYIGYAQYGGRFEEAEKSLCANWLRIKGDSRLSVEEAMLAARAAWEHAGRVQVPMLEEEELVEASEPPVLATQPRLETAYAA